MCVLLVDGKNSSAPLAAELKQAGITQVIYVDSAQAAIQQLRSINSSPILLSLEDITVSQQAMISFAKEYSEKTDELLVSATFDPSTLLDQPEFLISSIAMIDTLPALWMIPASLLKTATMQNVESFSDLAAEIILRAGQQMNEAPRFSSVTQIITMQPKLRSSFIKGALSCSNIEELFPNHAWADHQEESVAACYHTLAAQFIRLGDYAAAEDCLKQSETFEDSPRALALKAIISKQNGEILGAVAHMVSSLQQYEQRKADSKNHYLSFNPRNIEKVNSQLQEGLAALNNRDNEGALDKFTEAVFNFDSFYDDMGLH